MAGIDEAGIESGLKQLACSLRELKKLLEWARLVTEERTRSNSMSIRIDHNLDEEIRNTNDSFVVLAMDLHEILKQDRIVEVPNGEQLRKRYKRIVDGYRYLGTGVNVIR